MANTTGFMGFKHIGFMPGAAPDYQINNRPISSANATAIYRGDPVRFASGFVVSADAANSAKVDGIFDGCVYTDSSGVTKWSPYCPAAQAANGYVIYSPGALFLGQASNTAITSAQVNSNIGFVAAAGTTRGGGFSGYTLDSGNIGTTATYPFRIISLFSAIQPNTSVNGADDSTANNQAVVVFNNTDFKSGQTGN